jgi:hypothetical protein
MIKKIAWGTALSIELGAYFAVMAPVAASFIGVCVTRSVCETVVKRLRGNDGSELGIHGDPW